MQGVIKSYDPMTRDGVILTDTDMSEYDLASDALEGSVFRMLVLASERYADNSTAAGDGGPAGSDR